DLRDVWRAGHAEPAAHRRQAGAVRLADRHGWRRRFVRGALPVVPQDRAAGRGAGETALASRKDEASPCTAEALRGVGGTIPRTGGPILRTGGDIPRIGGVILRPGRLSPRSGRLIL